MKGEGLRSCELTPPEDLRIGLWTKAETNFALLLARHFKAGIFCDIGPGEILQTWLARRLHCKPMRISRKFSQMAVFGRSHKQINMRYAKNRLTIERLSETDIEVLREELETADRQYKESLLELKTKEDFDLELDEFDATFWQDIDQCLALFESQIRPMKHLFAP
jgi:hypothetical protein